MSSVFDQYHDHKDRIYRVVKQEVGNFYFGTDFLPSRPHPWPLPFPSSILQPFLDIHLNAISNFDIAPTGDARKLRIYPLIGFLILLIACINYINLSTAKAFKRTEEVGIRKTVGTYKRHLILYSRWTVDGGR